MTCDDRRDLMLLYAANSLDAAERAQLDEHLAAGCPACAGALAEAQGIVAHLPLTLPVIPAPSAARDRVMQRVLADRSSAAQSQPASAGRGSGPWLALAAAAAILVFVGGLVMRNITANYQDRLAAADRSARELGDQLRISDATAAELRDKLKLTDAELAEVRAVAETNQKAATVLKARDLQLVSLGKQDPQPTGRGRIIWDRDHNEWHVQVFDMKPPPPGRTFELWFITPDQKKIPAGTFDVDAKGNGLHFVKVPENIGPIALAAITDEPIGGVQVPTGSIHLAGAVQ